MEYKNLRKNVLEISKEPFAGSTFKNLSKLLIQNKFKIYPPYVRRFLYASLTCTLLTPFRIKETKKFDKKNK